RTGRGPVQDDRHDLQPEPGEQLHPRPDDLQHREPAAADRPDELRRHGELLRHRQLRALDHLPEAGSLLGCRPARPRPVRRYMADVGAGATAAPAVTFSCRFPGGPFVVLVTGSAGERSITTFMGDGIMLRRTWLGG